MKYRPTKKKTCKLPFPFNSLAAIVSSSFATTKKRASIYIYIDRKPKPRTIATKHVKRTEGIQLQGYFSVHLHRVTQWKQISRVINKGFAGLS